MSEETQDFLEDENCEKERLRPIAAVTQNQVEVVRELLDSPKYYEVLDEDGNSSLHLAILWDDVNVFDHLMSIPDFPLELVNKLNQTALALAFRGFQNKLLHIKEHFAYELIKNGANLYIDYKGLDTPLHCAIMLSYFKVAKLLIQKGVDVNSPSNYSGYTPLMQMLIKHPDNLEMLMTLLMSGAECFVSVFEFCVSKHFHKEILETMFLLRFDEYAQGVEISFQVIVRLSLNNYPLMYKLLTCPIKIIYDDKWATAFIGMCIAFNKETVRLILTRLDQNFEGLGLCIEYSREQDIQILPERLENLEMMLQTNLRHSVLNVMRYFGTYSIRTHYKMSVEADVTKMYCYFLSYGVSLEAADLITVYCKFGYGECFKILLHMDIPREPCRSFPIFIHNVGTDLETFLAHKNIPAADLNDFLYHFKDPRLMKLFFPHIRHLYDGKPDIAEPPNNGKPRTSSLTLVPLLVELARNAFRKYFVKTFNITTSRRFHTLVNSLDISITYKKIITLETELYQSGFKRASNPQANK